MMVFRYYSQLIDELMPFGDLDAPDLYFQFHNTESKGKFGCTLLWKKININVRFDGAIQFTSCPC
jgi:hypothetical protein